MTPTRKIHAYAIGWSDRSELDPSSLVCGTRGLKTPRYTRRCELRDYVPHRSTRIPPKHSCTGSERLRAPLVCRDLGRMFRFVEHLRN
jgi:hypothetical protein